MVVKDSVWTEETVAEMGKMIFRGFQCKVELDYITARRMLLVLVAKYLWKH